MQILTAFTSIPQAAVHHTQHDEHNGDRVQAGAQSPTGIRRGRELPALLSHYGPGGRDFPFTLRPQAKKLRKPLQRRLRSRGHVEQHLPHHLLQIPGGEMLPVRR